MCIFFVSAADLKVTQRSFNFGKKQGLPFYFVSAADGTNVVKVSDPYVQFLKVHYVTFLRAVNKQKNRVLDARNSSLQELTCLLDVLKRCTV